MSAIASTLLLSTLFLAIPFTWLVRHRGARRDRAHEGTVDGLTALAGYLVCLLAIALAVAALFLARRESRIRASWTPLSATIDHCDVREQRATRSSITYSAHCALLAPGPEARVEREASVRAPRSRLAVERWIAQHPPGSTVSLYSNPANPAMLWGLGIDSPVATSTARTASQSSVAMAMAGCAVFFISRIIVAARRARSPG